MRVLVTGCHGFLGHHVTAMLLARGHTVVGVDRISGARSPKADRIAAFAQFGKRVQFKEAHLHVWPDVVRLMKPLPEAIFHAAGQYSVAYTGENDAAYIQSNLIAATLLCWSVPRQFKVPRIVYASSMAVSDARKPSGLYGATKGYAEDALAAAAHRFKTSSISLRYGVLYGAMIRRDTDFFRTIDHHLGGRSPLPGSQFDKRTPMIEINDAAELAVRSLEANTRGAVVLPAVSPDGPHTYREVLHAAAGLTRRPAGAPPPPGPHVPTPPVDQTAVHNLLGWSPTTALPQGLERYLPWARTAITS